MWNRFFTAQEAAAPDAQLSLDRSPIVSTVPVFVSMNADDPGLPTDPTKHTERPTGPTAGT